MPYVVNLDFCSENEFARVEKLLRSGEAWTVNYIYGTKRHFLVTWFKEQPLHEFLGIPADWVQLQT